MSNTDLAVISAEDRVDMERRSDLRLAEAILFGESVLPRDVVRAHVTRMLVDSCIRQERWSRGRAA